MKVGDVVTVLGDASKPNLFIVKGVITSGKRISKNLVYVSLAQLPNVNQISVVKSADRVEKVNGKYWEVFYDAVCRK